MLYDEISEECFHVVDLLFFKLIIFIVTVKYNLLWYSSYKLIKTMGGDIKVANLENGGAEVTCLLTQQNPGTNTLFKSESTADVLYV